QMVSMGLCGVHELIRETHLAHPSLCSRTLQILLNILQCQHPESFKKEPQDVIESLYSLLMDLSQVHEPPPDNTRDSSDTISSLACSCLISLVLARGDTGMILAALSAMFILPCKFAQQQIKLPSILFTLHKSVDAMLIGRLPLGTWFDRGLKRNGRVATFTVVNSLKHHWPTSYRSNIASSGQFLFIQNCYGLFKVGSGYLASIPVSYFFILSLLVLQ
ncbi:hypothetical protein HELRODRAFT_66971, partial [Helobdella robusta]|uniref:Uncharacterized protein n=1 Tax=Helobdella robusta TaxID=6412 RepID=T1FYU2_HELRO